MTQFDPKLAIDNREADAAYKSFPSFKEWVKNSELDNIRWERYSNRLNGLKKIAGTDISKVREAIEIATAIDTGALEGLYKTDRGFTYTVAFESAVWQSVVEKAKGERVRALIEAQLSAFEYVLDFATKSVPITSAWIRELHNQICREQETYKAYTEIGLQDLPLPKGEFKTLSNHVRKQDGSTHSYAPADLTVEEMMRLCDELNAEDFQKAHPVLQASYAHYSFVLIHPFADGNGRVSRALASIFTYRSLSIPLLIFSDSRRNYLNALENADAGNFQSFIEFILEVGLSSIQLFGDCLENSLGSKPSEIIESINKLYVTKGGYSHEEVDSAGIVLLDNLLTEIKSQSQQIDHSEFVRSEASIVVTNHKPISNDYRTPLKGAKSIHMSLSSKSPARFSATQLLNLQIPKDCGQNDDFLIVGSQNEIIFEARAAELIPNITSTLQMRIKLFVKIILKNSLKQLLHGATEVLKN